MKKIEKISSFIITYLILAKNVLAQSPVRLGPIDGLGAGNVNSDDILDYTLRLEDILSTVIGFLTIFGGIYFIINFIIGGINWSTAGGDMEKVQNAQKKMTNGAIGLIIIVASFSIIYIISSVLGLDILNLSNTITRNLGPSPTP
jgi:hypothetical protein